MGENREGEKANKKKRLLETEGVLSELGRRGAQDAEFAIIPMRPADLLSVLRHP